jgi:hypothetical protein
LFGSGNVEGLVVTINVDGEAREFRVAGVVELERDSASTRAFEAQFGTTQACVFIPYIAYDPEGSKLTYTTYECVTREPFGGFLYNVFNGTQSAPRPGVLSGAEIVQNSGRFEVSKTYENLKTFAERTLRHSEVVYPYWENAAILVENRLVAPLVIGAICLLAPILTLVFLFGWGLKKTQGKWRVLVEFGGDALDVWRRYAWNRKLRKRERLENSRLEPGDIVPDNSANEE